MSRSTGSQLALRLLVCHLALVTVFGRYYAKLAVPSVGLPLFPTEIVVLVGAWLARSDMLRVPFDAMTKLVVAFIGLGGLWVLIGGIGDLHGAGVKALSFWVYSLLYFLVRGSAVTDEERWRLLRVFCLTAFVGAVLGLWQKYSGIPLFGGAEGYESGFEETSTGTTRWLIGEMALYGSFAAVIVTIESIVRRELRPADIAILVAASIELVFAQHRTAFVAFLITVVSTTFFILGSMRAMKGLLRISIIAAVLLVVFVALFGSTYLDETVNRIAHTSDMGDANIDWRLLNWYEVASGVREQPLGHGFALWDFLFTANNPLNGSHNSFLDLTYRVGVGGLLLLLAMPMLLIRQTRRVVQRTGAMRALLAITVCACMIAFLVFAFFNVVFETPHLSVLFWILLGIGAGALFDSRSVEVHVRATDVPVSHV